MSFYYAQIDENSICIAVTQAAGEIDLPNMIPIAFLNESLLGKPLCPDPMMTGSTSGTRVPSLEYLSNL